MLGLNQLGRDADKSGTISAPGFSWSDRRAWRGCWISRESSEEIIRGRSLTGVFDQKRSHTVRECLGRQLRFASSAFLYPDGDVIHR